MPTLTVFDPVTDRSLISLETLKSELGITGTDADRDARLTRWIKECSDDVTAACAVAPDQKGRRTFVEEEVVISYRPDEVPCGNGALLLPWRLPLDGETLEVVEDGVTLSAEDYELEPMSCLLWRVRNGCRGQWGRARVVITGTAGWALEDMPAALQTSVMDMVRMRNDAQGRDSYLKREDVEGVGEREWWTGELAGSKGAVPDACMDALRAAGLVNMVIG